MNGISIHTILRKGDDCLSKHHDGPVHRTSQCLVSCLLVLVPLLLFSTSAYAREDPDPKNIFILIADGWGINQILASNYWHGTDSTSYQRFPVQYFMSTYQGIQAVTSDIPALESFRTGYNSALAWSEAGYVMLDHTDSAPAATSMASGRKSAIGSLGKNIFGQDVELITERAFQCGKSAGVVTSVQWSHATPAAFSVHHINRDSYPEIARDMLLETRLSVIAGCGHPYYDNNSGLKAGEFNFDYVGGKEAWDTLVSGISNTFYVSGTEGRTVPMDIDNDGHSDPWTLIQDSIDFVQVMRSEFPPKRLLGTAKCATTLNQGRTLAGDLPYADDRNDNVPHLYQMALAAINILKENSSGFLLMVEGGAIDWAGHANQNQRLIEEQQDFNVIVDSIIAWIMQNGGWEENLMIVTGDHECGYLTGPDFDADHPTEGFYIANNGNGSMPGMKFNSSSHTNILIPFYANGTGSELFRWHADEIDYMFGPFIDNTEIGLVCMDLMRTRPLPRPRQVIYMIGQGMGFNHLLAANQYLGQDLEPFQRQIDGADFFAAAMATYPATTLSPDGQVRISDYDVGYRSDMAWSDPVRTMASHADAAAAATSMFAGIKTATGVIGLDHRGSETKNIADRAFETGKSLGMVSSMQFAQPATAALVAHSVSCSDTAEIANEIVIDSKLSLILGCGAPDFNADGQIISASGFSQVGGPETWEELALGATTYTSSTIHNNHTVQDVSGDGRADPWSMVRDSADFAGLATGKTPLRVIGIPKISGTLQQGRTRPGSPDAFEIPFVPGVPTLSDMTEAALNVLDKNKNGFLLLVAGAAIDRASRMHQMERLIEEQIDFNRSVNKVIDWVNENSSWDSTLLIITGSYESGYLTGPDYNSTNMINGYPVSGNGPGNLPDGMFLSDDITNRLVPFYAHGAGASVIEAYATRYDYVHGSYLNNTQPAQAIFTMWQNLPSGQPDIIYTDLLTAVSKTRSGEPAGDEVRVFPTLVQDHINVNLKMPGDATVHIFTIGGELVLNRVIPGSSMIDLRDIPPGIYVIRIAGNSFTQVEKFIKP